jgi:hypothetical protein
MGNEKKDDDPPSSPFEDVQEDVDDLTEQIEELDNGK